MSQHTTEYLFDTGSELGRRHMDLLAAMLDPVTISSLDAAGVRAGQRCLDLGAGGGSITRWLAERTGPTGTVVAVDLDTGLLGRIPGIEVHRHDINDGLPVPGPFDLIHARLLLMHLPRREEILAALVDALAPGGWLVIGDFSGRPLSVLSAPTRADADLFRRIQDIAHGVVSRAAGVSFEWAHEVDGHLTAAGLTNIHGVEFSQTTTGGSAGCQLHRNLVTQAEPAMRAAGAGDEELNRYRDLHLDPAFRAWFYEFVCTRGQKPAGSVAGCPT